jgi:Cu/Ag efflux pump CusA
LLSTLWLFISLFAPGVSRAVPVPPAGRTSQSLAATELQLWQAVLQNCFDASHPAASDDDNAGDVEDDNRAEAARYGMLANDVNATVQAAIGGQAVTQVLDGERRFDVVVRFQPQYRQSLEAISNIQINSPDGERIPLKQVAEIKKQTGASFVYREDNARYIPIKFSVRGRDLQSTIDDI